MLGQGEFLEIVLEESGDQFGHCRLHVLQAERAMARALRQSGQMIALADEPRAGGTDAEGPSPRIERLSCDATSVAMLWYRSSLLSAKERR